MYNAPYRFAAIQVGVPQRLVVIDLSKDGEERQPHLANPEIVSQRGAQRLRGRLPSIPSSMKWSPGPEVKVPPDRQGEAQEIVANGVLPPVQHEIDHLNGAVH